VREMFTAPCPVVVFPPSLNALYLKYDVSETGFCLSSGGNYSVGHSRFQSPKRRVLIKGRAADNVQNCDSYINIPS
jgi:hypothetical protein